MVLRDAGSSCRANSGSVVAHSGRESEGDWETEGDKKEEEAEKENIFREKSNNLNLNQNHALITGSKSGEPFCVADHTVWRCPCFPKNGPQPADLPAAIEEATAIPIATRRITNKTYEDSMCTILFL